MVYEGRYCKNPTYRVMKYQILHENTLKEISREQFADMKLRDEELYGSSVIHMNDCGTIYTLVPTTNVRYGYTRTEKQKCNYDAFKGVNVYTFDKEQLAKIYGYAIPTETPPTT